MNKFDCPICLESYPVTDGCILCSSFNNRGNPRKVHRVCINCIKGLAKSAIENNQIAEGGIGLRCSDLECPNIIPISKYHRNFIINLFYF